MPPLLPGLTVSTGTSLNGERVIRADIEIKGQEKPLAIVATPREIRRLVPFLFQQEDRRIRALAALLLRQADIVEGKHLRLVGEGDA